MQIWHVAKAAVVPFDKPPKQFDTPEAGRIVEALQLVVASVTLLAGHQYPEAAITQ